MYIHMVFSQRQNKGKKMENANLKVMINHIPHPQNSDTFTPKETKNKGLNLAADHRPRQL